MKHDERFPIEPLSQQSWRGIEQRLFAPAAIAERNAALSVAAKRRRSRSAGLYAAAAAAVLATLFGVRAVRRSEPVTLATRHMVAGEVALETKLSDATVALSANASALLHELGAEGALVVLQRGEARFSVPPRKGRAPFAVQAGAVRVEVVGTRFRVARSGAHVLVEDEEGRVRVLAGEQSTLLSPGESWSSDTPLSRRGEREPHVPEATVARATVAVRQQVASSQAKRNADRSKATRAPKARSHEGAKAAADDQARARFEQAARLEASEPEQALRGYGALASGGGPWAETALYAMGRLALERGDRARAAPLLHSYLRRYPRGANAADVRDLLAQLGIPSDEAEAP